MCRGRWGQIELLDRIDLVDIMNKLKIQRRNQHLYLRIEAPKKWFKESLKAKITGIKILIIFKKVGIKVQLKCLKKLISDCSRKHGDQKVLHLSIKQLLMKQKKNIQHKVSSRAQKLYQPALAK
jgi:hypothetical protein